MTMPPTSVRKAVFDGLIWGIGGKMALIIGNFAVLMITSRSLSAAEFGVFAAATVFSDLSWALATSAFGIGLVQKKALTEDDVAAGLVAYAAVAALVGFFMAVGGGLFEAVFRAPGLKSVLWAMAAASVLKVMTGYYGALLQRRLDLRYYQMTQNLPQLVGGCGLTLAGALLGWGVWSLVAGYALGAALEFVLTARRARAPHRLPQSWAAFSELLVVGRPTVINRLANFFATSIDRVIIGAALGPVALGIYTRAYSLMMVPVRLLGLAIQRTFLPAFSRLQDEESRLTAALQRVLSAQPVIFIPVGVGLILAAPTLVSVVLGAGWSDVILPAQILMGALVARLGYVTPEMAAIAIGEASGAAKRQILYGLAVVVGAVVGLPFGLAGVAVGVTIALFLFYFLSLRRAVVRLNCSAAEIIKGHIRGAAISTVATIASLAAGVLAALWGASWVEAWTVIIAYAIVTAGILIAAPKQLLGSPLTNLRDAAIAKIAHILVARRTRLQGPTI